MEYMLGLFADPIYKGDFPQSVKQRIPNLPTISSQLVCLGKAPSFPCGCCQT
jgi:hypothetical protein